MTAHLFILPRSCILSLPPSPSLIISNPPMYLLFCRTVRTSPARPEAGMTMHSFLCLISEFWRLAKRFASTFVAGIFYRSLLIVLLESKLPRNLPETLPAEHEVVRPDDRAVLPAPLAVVGRLPV